CPGVLLIDLSSSSHAGPVAAGTKLVEWHWRERRRRLTPGYRSASAAHGVRAVDADPRQLGLATSAYCTPDPPTAVWLLLRLPGRGGAGGPTCSHWSRQVPSSRRGKVREPQAIFPLWRSAPTAPSRTAI